MRIESDFVHSDGKMCDMVIYIVLTIGMKKKKHSRILWETKIFPGKIFSKKFLTSNLL